MSDNKQAVTDAEVEAAVLGIGEVGKLGFVSGSLVQKVLEAFAASRAAPAQPPSQIAEPATTVDAALTQEPEFYTAFASQGGGFVPLPGFSNETEKGVKNLVLEHARGTGYKGTVNGYLLQQGWVVLPVFATPQPAASVASRGEAEVIAAARAVIDEFGSSMDGPLQRLYQALRTHDAATAQLQPRTPAGPSEIESLIYKFECFICHATGGKLSKHTWALATLQSAADEHLNKHVAEMVQDALAAQPRTLDAPKDADRRDAGVVKGGVA